MSPLWSTYPGYIISSLSAVVQSKAARHHRVPQRTDLSLVPSFSELIELKGAFLAEIDFFCPLDTAIEDHVDDFCCTGVWTGFYLLAGTRSWSNRQVEEERGWCVIHLSKALLLHLAPCAIWLYPAYFHCSLAFLYLAISILMLIFACITMAIWPCALPHFTPSPVISWWFAQVYDYCLLLVSPEKVELTIRTSYEDSYLLLLLVVILT